MAGIVYSDDFTSGFNFTTNDPYWLDNNRANGFITTTTNTSVIWPGIPDEFGAEINSGVGGTGDFLFDGTFDYSSGNPDIPAGQDEYFIGSAFAVAPNTTYDVSFYLTSANGTNSPLVQPEIDGALLGSAVSPVGTWGSNGWQQFSFTWNSGSNTTASLILHDLTATPTGNDFGTANILVSTPAPEPATLPSLLALGCALFGLVKWRSAARAGRTMDAPQA